MSNRAISIVSGVAFSFAASGFAFAADMPVKAPPVLATRPPLPSWEGFYVGGDIGYGIGISELSENSISPFHKVHQTFDGNFFGSHGVVAAYLAVTTICSRHDGS